MLDFTSALYLGMRHAHTTLRPWAQLTTGRPAALSALPGADAVAHGVASLQGCERGTLGPSSLHIFWDLFDVLSTEPIGFYVDRGTYPIVRWGIERVAAKGVPTADFQRHDPAALEALLQRDRRSGFRPVVVTDGLCPASGRTAPLKDYSRLIEARGGYLVIDDTQALGILGTHPSPHAPYGWGGGGSPAWHAVHRANLIVGSSLAKGFGVPLAVLAGSARVIAKFENLGATQVHCSPPSAAVISAAERALAINEGQGNSLRNRLLRLVLRFREGLRQVGLSASGGCFPVQTLKPISAIDAVPLHERMLRLGVRTVLHRARNGQEARLSCLITALHTPSDIDRCVESLQQACARTRRQCGGKDREPALHA